MRIPELYLVSKVDNMYKILKSTKTSITRKNIVRVPTSTTFLLKNGNTIVFTPSKSGLYGTIEGNISNSEKAFNLFECYSLGYTVKELLYWLNNLDEYYEKYQEQIDMDIIYNDERD